MPYRFVVPLVCLTLIAADAPTTSPASEKRTLLDGQIEYAGPADWSFSPKNATQEQAVFVSGDRLGALSIIVQPQGMIADPPMAKAILKKLREERQKAGSKVIQELKLEQNKDFDIRISETYEEKDRTFAKLYLYRQRGKRTLSVTVTAIDKGDAAATQAILKAGEDTLLSAKWVKK